MTAKEYLVIYGKVSDALLGVYGTMRVLFPKEAIIVAMIGTVAACAKESGLPRENAIAVMNSAFDDMEGNEG